MTPPKTKTKKSETLMNVLEKGNCWKLDLKRLVRESGYSGNKAVLRALKRLVKDGVLTKEYKFANEIVVSASGTSFCDPPEWRGGTMALGELLSTLTQHKRKGVR